MPNRPEEMALLDRYKTKGDKKALHELVRGLRPLYMVHVNKWAHTNVPSQVLEQHAVDLTIKAIKSYDPNRGAQLNTHIMNRLKKMSRYAQSHADIGYIPENRRMAYGTFQNVRSNLREKINREPNVHELSDELRWKPAEVKRMLKEDRPAYIEDINNPSTFETVDPHAEFIHKIHFGLDPEAKLVFEHLAGESLGRQPIKASAGISKATGMPLHRVIGARKRIVKAIKSRGYIG